MCRFIAVERCAVCTGWVHGLNKLLTFSILRLIEPKFLGCGGGLDVSQREGDRLESWPGQIVEY
jgi:hypothetical protein